jgi:hypothetical protein
MDTERRRAVDCKLQSGNCKLQSERSDGKKFPPAAQLQAQNLRARDRVVGRQPGEEVAI